MSAHPSIHPTRQPQKGWAKATRELACRLSGTNEVLLLWHPTSERVELSVRDVETGQGFQLEVPANSAMDAFHHPYAYATRRESHG